MNYPKEIWDFIEANQETHPADLALLISKQKDWPKEFILQQVKGRQIAKKKFPTLLQTKNYIFPPTRALEQASSEATALFKASLVEGKKMLDLSGGMGIDSWAFAKRFEQLFYVEKDHQLVALAQHNFKVLGLLNIQVEQSQAGEYLSQNKEKVDLIYLDPDRREQGSRYFKLSDCSPKLPELLPTLNETAHQLLIKLSPLFDLREALKELESIAAIYIVSVRNDCKELLINYLPDYRGSTRVVCVNLQAESQPIFEFDLAEEKGRRIEYSQPLAYLYEPNASVMKSGAFASLAKQFSLKKLAPNTHLFTSNERLSAFPGRILKVLKYGKVEKGFCKQANVVSRNFPLKPDQIRKRYKITEGRAFCYACSLAENKKVFILADLLN